MTGEDALDMARALVASRGWDCEPKIFPDPEGRRVFLALCFPALQKHIATMVTGADSVANLVEDAAYDATKLGLDLAHKAPKSGVETDQDIISGK